MVAAWDTLEKITKKEQPIRDKIAAIKNKTLFPTDDDITVEKVMALPWESVEGKLYDRVSKWFYKNYCFVRQNGYFPETGQLAVQVCLYKREAFEPQLKQVQDFVPYIKPINVESKDIGAESAKMLGVFEHTLSEHGVYSIFILAEDEVVLTCQRYHLLRVENRFQDLESCLRYVQEHHYYEDSKE